MTWPHEGVDLTEPQKQAYRYLLYRAMLDIRILCQSRGEESRHPMKVWAQYRRSRVAGALADWLHNLALYSSQDFQGFSADSFWKEYAGLERRFDLAAHTSDYRTAYKDELRRCKAA